MPDANQVPNFEPMRERCGSLSLRVGAQEGQGDAPQREKKPQVSKLPSCHCSPSIFNGESWQLQALPAGYRSVSISEKWLRKVDTYILVRFSILAMAGC